MLYLIKVFFKGKHSKIAYAGLITILTLTLTEVYLSFEFLKWYTRFYDSLEVKDLVKFKRELLMFSILAMISICQYTFLKYINQRYTLRWREAITVDILRRWKNQYIEGYAQRIQEDCAKFARLFESLFIGCFNAIISLIVFIPVLMGLSHTIYGENSSYLLFICLGYTFFGILFSIFLGRKLPRLEYNNQKVEAKFRRSLEYKRNKYGRLLIEIRKNYLKLFNKYKIFNFFSSTFFQTSIILPYLLVGKYYFLSVITLGVLVQTSKAFNRVNTNFNYLVDSWLHIVELQSVVIRLNEFNNLIDKKKNASSRI